MSCEGLGWRDADLIASIVSLGTPQRPSARDCIPLCDRLFPLFNSMVQDIRHSLIIVGNGSPNDTAPNFMVSNMKWLDLNAQ